MEFIDDVTQELNGDNRSAILANLHGLLGIITLHIKDLQQHINFKKRNYAKWEKICQKNPDFANKYSLSMAQSKENELLCKSLLCRALAVNRDICLCCSTLNGSVQNASSSYHVHLENQSNFWSLLSLDYLEEFLENDCKKIFVKQQSDLWFKLLLLVVCVLMLLA